MGKTNRGEEKPRARRRRGQRQVSPLQVHGGDVEDDSFEPQDHEQPLGEGTVPDALAITPRLQETTEGCEEKGGSGAQRTE